MRWARAINPASCVTRELRLMNLKVLGSHILACRPGEGNTGSDGFMIASNFLQ